MITIDVAIMPYYHIRHLITKPSNGSVSFIFCLFLCCPLSQHNCCKTFMKIYPISNIKLHYHIKLYGHSFQFKLNHPSSPLLPSSPLPQPPKSAMKWHPKIITTILSPKNNIYFRMLPNTTVPQT
jgi:hypothetical protein